MTTGIHLLLQIIIFIVVVEFKIFNDCQLYARRQPFFLKRGNNTPNTLSVRQFNKLKRIFSHSRTLKGNEALKLMEVCGEDVLKPPSLLKH